MKIPNYSRFFFKQLYAICRDPIPECGDPFPVKAAGEVIDIAFVFIEQEGRYDHKTERKHAYPYRRAERK